MKYLLIVAGWALYGLFAASQTYLSGAYSQRVEWSRALNYAMLDAGVWAALTPAIFWFASRFPLLRGRHMAPLHFLAGILFAVAHMTIFVRLLPLIGYKPPARGPGVFQTLMMARFHSNLLTCWVVSALWHGTEYYRRYRDREARLARAQLQVLKMQLQPHFLFNTLHAISALMYKDVEAADRMMARLSDFLRLTLDTQGVDLVPLQREMEFLGRYLDIEQIRFGERLRVAMDIEPEALDVPVPTLILQPLVENAVRHGIAPRAEGGQIRIQARRTGHQLEIIIADDGVGATRAGTEKPGVGLANTRARLEQLYLNAHRFDAAPRPEGGFEVRIAIPIPLR